MKKILIACAMRKEAEALQKHMGEGCEVCATGLGVQRAVSWILKRFRTDKPDLLIFTGSAGQLDPSLTMKDVVLPRCWCLEEGPCFSSPQEILDSLKEEPIPVVERGLTIARAVMSAAQKTTLFESTSASVYDSSTAAVVKVSLSEDVPCLAPKIVAHAVQSGLLAFWNDLDTNMVPLALILDRLIRKLD